MDTIDLMFSLIRSELKGTEITPEVKDSISMDTLAELYSLSAKHDIAHILGNALSKAGLLSNDKVSERFKKTTLMAFYRYEHSKYEFNRICESLNNTHIPFIPLKGAVIRDYYPEAWLRTSCDIDILVTKEDLEKTIDTLCENIKYSVDYRGSHDVSLHSENGIHLELHFDLVEEGRANSACRILRSVWDYSKPKNDYKYWMELSDEMLYCYHIAHMAKHFETGGCGIRPFIDLGILENKKDKDINLRVDLLHKGGLFLFSEIARKLSRVWLENIPYDMLTKKLANYIISGGVYGSLENRVVVQQQKHGGKLKYLFSRVIIPYDALKIQYPILQKYSCLTAVMQVHRWFKLIFCGSAKRSIKELAYNRNITNSEAEEMKIFLQEIGL